MRYIVVGTAAVLLLAMPLFAQLPGGTEGWKPPDLRPVEVMSQLAQWDFSATRNVPASDRIFIELGRVIEGLLNAALAENKVAFAAGARTKVSSFVILDSAIQVFLENDACALVILTKNGLPTQPMTAEQLVNLARSGLAALFRSDMPESKEPRLPT
jgi:hypothetical protein